MDPKPRKRPWRERRLTRQEEEASVRLLLIGPALLVAVLAPLSWCRPPELVAATAAPAAVAEAPGLPLNDPEVEVAAAVEQREHVEGSVAPAAPVVGVQPLVLAE
jgi:hypothetical protein